MSNLQGMPSKKYTCKCGKNFPAFKRLKRHINTKIFCYDCLLCGSGTNSWDHLIQHYRNLHPTHPLPTKSTFRPSASTSPAHSTHLEIEHLRKRSSIIPTNLSFSIDVGFREWLECPLPTQPHVDSTPPPINEQDQEDEEYKEEGELILTDDQEDEDMEEGEEH